ncbi:MAG: lysine 6-dehydrogenase [Limisphaerales bacterium]|jgi:lysine 6-dehydrogenase
MSDKSVIVLGAGMVGRAMAIDLAKDFKVSSADIDEAALKMVQANGVNPIKADLSDADAIRDLVQDYDLVVGAVPGFLGFQMMETVIDAGINIVDISFYDEDPFRLDALAKEKGVTAVMDAGVAPGMDNVLLGYHAERMKVNRFECLVGGLPKERHWPYEYKAPFSPIDVLEEYTRPARIVENGEMVVREALSEPELIQFPNIGTLEAFNSDGLRTLVKTMDIPNMVERTLRYPGHIELMRVLRETGFFSKERINIHGSEIRPIDMTSQLLFPKWKLGENEKEFTVMRVTIEGEENGKPKTYFYDLLDRYDAVSNTSSMSRTTGFTCTGVARLIINGQYKHAGISPPEYIGKDENCFRTLLKHLEDRGVHYCATES